MTDEQVKRIVDAIKIQTIMMCALLSLIVGILLSLAGR